MKSLLSPSPFLQPEIIAILRITLGLLLIYHGKEIFEPETMNGYTEWDLFKGPYGLAKAYVGKGSEFVAGVMLGLGLLTRLGALITIGTFSYITFFVANGRFWYEDQHPFMFLLFGWLFLFTGPGKWNLDQKIFGEPHHGAGLS